MPNLGQRKGPAPPLPERGRENAGAVTGLEQRNALARPLLPPDGVAGGKSPSGGCKGGEGKDARDVTATPVAGANLAYRLFISFPDPVYSLIYSPIYSLTGSLIYTAIYSATYPAIYTTQIDFDFFHYIS